MLGTLTCGDTVDNADAMDPLDTRRLRQDAGSSRRKGGSSSWTWERYFLQQNTMLLIIPYLSERIQIAIQFLQLKWCNLFVYIYIFRMKFNIFQTMSNFPVLKPNVQFINQGINELICYIF